MKHIEVVGAIIIRDGRILCLQRNVHEFEYLSHKYEFPGGKVEPEESREAALQREIEEELDLKVDVLEEFLTVDHSYPDFRITLHTYLCRARHVDFTLREHVDFRWLAPADLETLDWAAADLPIVSELSLRNI